MMMGAIQGTWLHFINKHDSIFNIFFIDISIL
jgi:hypothetical protein